MTDHTLFRIADILGIIVATTCISLTLPELADNLGLLTITGYTFGIIVITNKINRALRKG